ncbi:MAG: DNA polymerase III subunit gamma/tau [Haliscomenobacteraceae bacterium CHB4]|nr:Holliday junction ATP-dependent DNA helicase RuvB [Saprospiraceae bacterium]MCE7924296.1 DNA polymerase III subunit gamma/tau [Haliscomenobacteraceae bacterium CHB4]
MSNFIVSARKYRPQRFEDVVGQQHVAGTLKNALATDHVAHAFLFTGPRGVGKTTCARILAKTLNCENRTKDFEACNECPSCKAFNEDASWNIFELDAASNNGVDHIRALVEQVRVPPQRGKFKVYIIDEVHMLSQGAFNAFLKTLEEPPPYAIFILATTEKHKVIPTILSRCQIFDFRRITTGDMVLHLRDICRKEGIEAEEDALHIIAQKADGALRDALSIFDRITSSASGRNIRYDDVIENLNVLDYDYYFQITDALLAEDSASILNLFDQILRKGFEPDVFIIGLAEHLRNILVCKDEATLALLEAGDSLRERYRKQAALSPASFLLTALNICNDCDVNFKMARHKRLHVEMALLKMCFINRAVKAAQIPVFSEKKTPDATVEGGRLTADGGQPSGLGLNSSTGYGNAATNPQSPIPNPPETAAHGNAQPLSKKEMIELASGLRQGLKKAEAIPLSLDAYEQAVAVEEAEKAALESRLTIENARSEWNAYAASVESPTLRQAMTAALLDLDDKTLSATVGMTTHRSLLQQELARLLDTLRLRLHDPVLKIQVLLDESKAQELRPIAPKRPLTAKEKLDKMKEVNPLVEDLLKRFDLKLDE